MRQSRISMPIPRPVAPGDRPSTSISTAPTTTFRPRGALAVGILVIPALIFLALIIAVLIAGVTGQSATIILGIGCGMAIGWVACVFLFARVLLMSVQATNDGLTTGYPGGGTRTVRWTIIDRADRQMGILRLRASDGTGLLIFDVGLTDGQQLLRQIILRVSPTVLSEPLQRELAVLGGNLAPAQTQQAPFPQLGIAPIWSFLAGGIAVGGAALATWGSAAHGIGQLAAGAVIGLFGVFLLIVMRQAVILTEAGVTITHTLGGPRTMGWSEIKLIEQLPLEMMLALRGTKRIVFLGPFFMTPARRDLLRNAFHDRLIDHGIPVYQRWWIL